MPIAITLLVFALAVARVTRFVTEDRLADAPRRWLSIRLWAPKIPDAAIQTKYPAMVKAQGELYVARVMAEERLDAGADPPLAVYLLTCPWCASIYVAVPAVAIWWLWGDTPYAFLPALWLAFSQFTGLLAKIGS